MLVAETRGESDVVAILEDEIPKAEAPRLSPSSLASVGVGGECWHSDRLLELAGPAPFSVNYLTRTK
jgi:hypothetical protein